MQVQHVLRQPAPELLNGICPGRISRQANQFKPGMRQSLKDIGMKMNRPVVLNDENALGVGISPLELGIKMEQFVPTAASCLQRNDPSGKGIEGGSNPALAVATPALKRTRRVTGLQGEGARQRGTTIIGQFILVEQDQALWLR